MDPVTELLMQVLSTGAVSAASVGGALCVNYLIDLFLVGGQRVMSNVEIGGLAAVLLWASHLLGA